MTRAPRNARKRWTLDEDLFLLAFFELMGDFIGEHDLDRPPGAATARYHHLKKTGAWAALEAFQESEFRHQDKQELLARQYYAALGIYGKTVDHLYGKHLNAKDDR